MCQRITKVYACGHHLPTIWKCERKCGWPDMLPKEHVEWLKRVRSGEEPQPKSQISMSRKCDYCRTAQRWFWLFFICFISCFILLGHSGLIYFLYLRNYVSWESARRIWIFDESLVLFLFIVACRAHRQVQYLADKETRLARLSWPPFIPDEWWIHGKCGWKSCDRC